MTDSFPRRQARTRRFTLGAPRSVIPSPDGARVAFLRSRGGTDTVTCLWCLDVATGEERLVADPRALETGTDEDLPAEERMRRERAREQAGGIVAYATDRPVTMAAFALSGRLYTARLETEELDPGRTPQQLDSPGPVFFRQTRVGRGDTRFQILKFRTMRSDAEERKIELRDRNETRGLFKISNDPRITRIGRLLRRSSLDELPQLWNVLRGEMSLVGPRPLVLDEDQRIQGWYRRRLSLTPGMTGDWQVFGAARIPLREMATIDYLYVSNWSLWADIRIMLRTIPFIVHRRGQ